MVDNGDGTVTNNDLLIIMITIVLSVIIGSLTFTGSFIAFGKLQGFISGKPIVFKGQQLFNALLAILLFTLIVLLNIGFILNFIALAFREILWIRVILTFGYMLRFYYQYYTTENFNASCIIMAGKNGI